MKREPAITESVRVLISGVLEEDKLFMREIRKGSEKVPVKLEREERIHSQHEWKGDNRSKLTNRGKGLCMHNESLTIWLFAPSATFHM